MFTMAVCAAARQAAHVPPRALDRRGHRGAVPGGRAGPALDIGRLHDVLRRLGSCRAGLAGRKKCTPEEKKSKGDLMFYHKSFGALAMAALVPRLAVRLASRAKIPAVPEGHFLEQMAGRVSHLALYGFIIALPVTGVTMGMMGGKGVLLHDAHAARARSAGERWQALGKATSAQAARLVL